MLVSENKIGISYTLMVHFTHVLINVIVLRLPIKIVCGIKKKPLLTKSYFRAFRTIWLIPIETFK